MLEMRAAAAGVRYDGVELLRRKPLDVSSGQLSRQFPFAVVPVKRAAAMLLGRGDDFAAVAGQHLNCVAVHIAEYQVLGAPRQDGHSISLRSRRRGHGRNHLGRKLRLHRRCHRFQFAQTLGKQFQETAATDKSLQAKFLVQAQGPARQLQARQIHEQPAKRDATNPVAGRRFQDAAALCFGAGALEQFRVIHPRRTGCHARQTTQTEIHFLGERPGRFQPAVGDGAHQRDAAAGTVPFQLGRVIGRARRKAKPAVHALLHDGIVELFEV